MSRGSDDNGGATKKEAEHARFIELAAGFCEASLSEPQWRELEALLLARPALRAQFQTWSAIHGQLAWSFGGRSERPLAPLTLAGSKQKRGWSLPAIRMLSIVGLAATVLITFLVFRPHPSVAPENNQGPIVASLADLVGEAEIVSPTGQRTTATAHQALRLKDTLRTLGEDGFAAVTYEDGTRLELSPETELQFVPYLANPDNQPLASGKKLLLMQGTVRAQVAKQPADQPLLLASPNAQMRVLGTSLTFTATNTSSRVELEEGQVQFTRKFDGQAVDVEAGFYAVAASDRPLRAEPLPKLKSYAQTILKPGGGGGAVLDPGAAFLAGLRSKVVQTWNVRTGEETAALKYHHGKATRLLFSPNSRLLVIAGSDGKPLLWNLDQSAPHKLALEGAPLALAFSADSKTVALVGKNSPAAIQRWDAAGGAALADWVTTAGGIASLAFAPDGKSLALGTMGGRVVLWDIASERAERTFAVGNGYVTGVLFSPDGRWIAAMRRADAKLMLWSVEDGGDPVPLSAHGAAIHAIAFSPDSRFLAAGTHDGNVTVWTAADKTESLWFTTHGQSVLSLAFTADSQSLLSASYPGLIEFWRMPKPAAGL
ncbi:MAG TPA: FecR domain-containing protein [Pirellulales bacterium]|jgi:hypothetical protein|nr:FecR domain-containing protein [Pirellulales bacterium]